MQFLPFYDDAALSLLRGVESRVYQHLLVHTTRPPPERGPAGTIDRSVGERRARPMFHLPIAHTDQLRGRPRAQR